MARIAAVAPGIRWFLACLVVTMGLSCAACATPYFMVGSAAEWSEAMLPTGEISPMTSAEWGDYMVQWTMHLVEGDPYPINTFLPPELYVWGGGGGGGLDPEDAGLVMTWGDETIPSGSYSSAWKYEYGLDPDLTGSTINITVTAPQFTPVPPPGSQINAVSFGIQDVAGNIRSWQWSCGAVAGPGVIQWNTPTQITINPTILSVNAANPVAAGFANNPFFNLVNSASFIVDENAQWVGGAVGVPPPGSTVSNPWNYWSNLSVTPPIPTKNTDPLKWSQPPVEVMPHQNPPVFIGWDEQSMYWQPPICADDWKCTDDRPVTDIHWWGSFIGWDQPDPPQLPTSFHLAIWTDIPDPDGPGPEFSHPGTLIWEHFCDTFTWNFAGYDEDPRGIQINEACFQFHQYLPTDHWFYQDPSPEGTVYWLSIAAIYDTTPTYPWGWKTREHFFNDDAVRIQQVLDPTGGPAWPPSINYTWGQGGPIEYPAGTSWDLAFELTTNEELPDELDWGDAPDGPYPTLSANNGANHVIGSGLMLGVQIDAENDGQQDPKALGDDNNPPLPAPDDEDGVTWSTPLIPGQNATVAVVATIPGTLSGLLDAWIDFNGDGVWDDTAGSVEKIAASLVMTNGLNSITFAVPNGIANGVKTFARFRLSSAGGLTPVGAASDGEVEDHQVGIGFKWVQHPDLSTTGIDINATNPFILADDFYCKVTGPITDIHIWGSWLNDILPEQDPSQVKFKLSIHKDIPGGPSYSRPGDLLWYREFQPGSFMVHQYATDIDEGWLDPPTGYVFPGDHTCWLYEFYIMDEPFIQRGTETEPVVYWLDVQAEPVDGVAKFGWKTSLEHWNDDAVYGQGQEPYLGPWNELRYPPGHELYPQSIDMAFAITGNAQSIPVGSLTFSVHQVIPDHFWWPQPGNPLNEMLCFDVTTDAVEAVKWETIQLTHGGTGNAADVLVIDVWQDVDGDCKYSAADVWLGWGSYVGGVANITLTVQPVLPAGSTFPALITYRLANPPVSPVGSTFNFQVTAASGTGQTSGLPAFMLGLPISSATKTIAVPPITIGEAKKLPIGTQFLLQGKICTANFRTNMSLVYIEEPKRMAGIGILTNVIAIPTVNEWDRVSVLGVCTLINSSELVVSPQQIIVTPGVFPPLGSPRFPVGMNNKWTGGGLFGGPTPNGQPGVYDDAWAGTPAYGLSNVGMAITTWGEVTYHESAFPWRPFPLPAPFNPAIPLGDMFWIDDGTNLKDGFRDAAGGRTVGIACWLPSPYGEGLPNPGEYWGITGILRAIPSPFGWPGMVQPVRLLVPRNCGDLIKYNP